MIRPLLAACAGLALVLAAGPASATTHGDTGFVTRHGDDLTLNGKEFRFAGSNNYRLMYRSPAMVDDVFADAKAAGFTVLRTWGFLDIGAQDDTGSVHHKENGVYFQYWDGTRPAYNDGPDGLQHLDQVVKSARDKGIRLVIPLTNNWSAFGGMDQYVRWRGGAHHDDFYTDPVIRGWYKDWISHVLNRTNSLTGVKYKDDPTIMAWELANEPRCVGSGVYPRSAACTDATVTAWAADISAHLDSVDRKHLISPGDEGFLCTDRASSDFTVNCADGVDSAALAALPAVDFMSFHLYPDHWKKDPSWGSGWITTHARLADRLRKPVMLGEFGLLDKASRNVVYQQWTDAAVSARLDGFLYWILSGVQDDGTDYPDYDGFTVYCPSPVCTTVANAGDELRHGRRSRPPVADHDTAQTLRDDPVTLTPAANDIAYRTRVKAATIDLDPAAAGQQTTVTLPGGSFGLNAKTGVVTFTPAAGFVGRVAAPYTIRDEAGRTSNVAELRVTVKNRPGDALVLASFEAGTEGWAAASWQSNAGTVAQTTEFHPEGSAGLRVTTADGGWFGVGGLTGVDLSGKSALRYELHTTTGTSYSIAVQTGDAYTWCQSTWGYASAGSTTTVEADLATAMSCDAAALADVRAVYVWFDGNGTHDIDHLRAQ
ncbi:cellulase family glycosylhydrolase [Dactylosporangium sp. NPDC049742]|uniref:cellulase family glycosylhydrolase n=1 Tax=Dactylosporangium sp. NPDC049742 TaxID=3154737 RepID=UPI00343AE799